MYIRDDLLETTGSFLVGEATRSHEDLVRALFGEPSPGFDPDEGYHWRYAFFQEGEKVPVTFYDRFGRPRVGSTRVEAGREFLAWLNELAEAEYLIKSPEGEIWSGDALDLSAFNEEYAEMLSSLEPGDVVTTITGFVVCRPSFNN